MNASSQGPVVSAADFAGALARPDLEPPKGLTGPDGRADRKRFNVYRNNVAVSLREALASTFPAIVALLGDAYFSALVREFVSRHPPRSAVLMWYGAEFAGFLEGFPPLSGYPYLGDVARVEWAWLQAYHAADALILDPAELAAVPEEDLASVIFERHPAAAVLPSSWPVLDLVRLNRFEQQSNAQAGFSGRQSVLVARPDVDVSLSLLKPGGDVFVCEIFKGVPLGAAAEAAAASSAEFDLGLNLSDCLLSGIFAGMKIG